MKGVICMKKVFCLLLLTMIALLLFLPIAALAEDVQPGVVPSTEYDWTALASVAGATAFTLLFVQFIKAPLDRVWKIPTRAVVYFIAFGTLLVAQVFTAGFTWSGLALTAVNAVVAGSAAMGAYELTFAKSDERKNE